MKDTIISARRKKIEIITFIICFVIANLANVYAIMTYRNTSFSELFTSLGYVTVAAIVLYIIWSIIRIIFYGVKSLVKPKKAR
ncbi:hypothetical protein [Dysgonomonas sp. 25]|uniref:hypothetical protein n=1 Tax=Dysgonomonas sp. 25 TaxID=2302933 RepID=UPI0013CF87FE|nr:hypothetical protein [Dysgonomonas sp. 25]NDV67414.1 hypothetical protein [Dysgonomonas sp. 25]